MAAKKKTSKKRASKAKAPGKKAAKKVAKTVLGRLAQKGAQLILDSGVLGKLPPKKAAKKKKTRKA
ncbi:MAG TPA: hypothetical protein VIW29_09880 [Polyangiaceae bacterium]